jgi:hypothetical protein
MTDAKDIEGWPNSFNRVANAAQIHALGQVTLVYNYLEEAVGRVFIEAMPTNQAFSEQLYHKLNNRDRIDLLTAVTQASDRDADVKEAILHLLNCHDICSENRNILMHAIIDSVDADIVTAFKKASRDPTREIQFRLPLADLRLVADEMSLMFVYAMRIQNCIISRAKDQPTGPMPEHIQRTMDWLGTTPEKPPKPRRLIPYKPPADQKDGEFQPQSSGA